MNHPYQHELAAARQAAASAAEILRHYFAQPPEVRLKADRSPVTVADEEAEARIREILLAATPDYGFYGEESGGDAHGAGFTWLVDPLDGTKSFVRGYPFFSTQIALARDGVPMLGVSSAPLFDELAWGVTGVGAWLNDQPLRVSSIATLDDAALSTGNLGSLARSERWRAFGDVVARVNRIRGYGDFYHYHLLAAGKIDAVVESDVNILDIAALAVIVEAAGGRFTDLEGAPIGIDTTSVLATNGELYATLSGALSAVV